MMMKKLIAATALMGALTACSEDEATFSILAESNSFIQTNNNFNNKIDVLFVIDNSGSMAPYQANLAANFSSFIQDFQTKGFDYRIAVITTDAWQAEYSVSQTWRAAFRSNSGSALLTPSTTNLSTAFSQNINQGTGGYGDERAFQSFEVALENGVNDGFGFPRSDAFLAVIIVSDEDDFSHPTSAYANRNYNYGLDTVQSYVSYLDSKTQSTATVKKYNVSAIAALDQACVNNPASHPDTIIGQRYMSLANLTNGILGSICDSSFSTNLNQIQNRIAELSTQFYLTREPIISSIRVQINGTVVPQNSSNGWSYSADANSVRFHGNFIPNVGDSIIVDYDPVSLDL